VSGWPVAADYDEAIQNPHLNFDDRELKEGEPEYDPYGSPAVRSGNFASVYMLQTPKRKVAVRCFLREIPDQQERYQAISRDLLGLGLPYTVNFEFLSKGIKVHGDWFPVLKMDWCDGEQLDRYLERNLDNQAKIRRLADKWFEMSVALRKVGIAHGDLSHGNIMVLDDEFKLIDYDGMFVPRLAGRKSNERGLEHYQHPGRTDDHFGRYLDNFSHWVTYTTLVGLGEDKELWRLVNIADKHLIFNKNDFEHPNRSKTFDILKTHEDKTLRTYATTVENLLQYDVEQIPDFHPDKPILYPPESVTKKSAATKLGDRGGLFKPLDEQKVGDRGNLFENKPKESDRGNLFVEPAKVEPQNNLPQKAQGVSRYGRSVSPLQIGVGVLAATAVIGLIAVTVPSLLKNNTEDTQDSPVKLLLTGINSAKTDDTLNARKAYQKIISNKSIDAKLRSKALTLYGLTYVEPALNSGEQAKLVDATQCFTDAIALDKDNAEAFYSRGKMYEAMKKTEAAKDDFKSSKSIDGNVQEYKDALTKLSK
jgi:tetratricopeptide (TPR) repeat protein